MPKLDNTSINAIMSTSIFRAVNRPTFSPNPPESKSNSQDLNSLMGQTWTQVLGLDLLSGQTGVLRLLDSSYRQISDEYMCVCMHNISSTSIFILSLAIKKNMTSHCKIALTVITREPFASCIGLTKCTSMIGTSELLRFTTRSHGI